MTTEGTDTITTTRTTSNTTAATKARQQRYASREAARDGSRQRFASDDIISREVRRASRAEVAAPLATTSGSLPSL